MEIIMFKHMSLVSYPFSVVLKTYETADTDSTEQEHGFIRM
jgi:hypothetical protein